MLRRCSLPRRATNLTVRDRHCQDTLCKLTPMVYATLPNGFRVATEHLPGCPFSTIGVWIDAGSRFETPANNGVAHFLEHMNFKGTARYSKQAVESLFEQQGAHFNAYTSRDRTAYYVKAFNPHIPGLIDVVADLLQNAPYDAADIELERPTILAEMREVEELVDEVLMDELHRAAYDPRHSGLPLTILGPVENIARTINRDQLTAFVRTHYTGPRMCLVSAGGLTPDQTYDLAERFFGRLPARNDRPLLQGRYTGGTTVLWNATMATTNSAVAFPICGASCADSYALQLLHHVIGQFREGQFDQFAHQRLNPRLPWPAVPNLIQLRPFYTPYEETALLGYQIVTARADGPAGAGTGTGTGAEGSAAEHRILLDYLLSTFYELTATTVAEDLLEQAKCEYKAAVLMMRDSTTNSAEDIGRQMIHFGRRVPMEEVFEFVDAVTPRTLREVAQKYFSATIPTVAAIGAAATLPCCDAHMRTSLRLYPRTHAEAFPEDLEHYQI